MNQADYELKAEKMHQSLKEMKDSIVDMGDRIEQTIAEYDETFVNNRTMANSYIAEINEINADIVRWAKIGIVISGLTILLIFLLVLVSTLK